MYVVCKYLLNYIEYMVVKSDHFSRMAKLYITHNKVAWEPKKKPD